MDYPERREEAIVYEKDFGPKLHEKMPPQLNNLRSQEKHLYKMATV